MARGVEAIIASGGDGTLSAVAGAIVGTNIPLGIISRGTANAFSNALDVFYKVQRGFLIYLVFHRVFGRSSNMHLNA